MSQFLMPLGEYNRIYQVAHGVLRDVGRAEKACKFFACFGALVLNRHYKIPARPVAGGFALCVDAKPEVACFGHLEAGRVTSSPEGFHMWVQTKTHLIDFMAPIFPEAFADAGRTTPIPRKMMQRSLASEAASLDELDKPGAFFTLPDPGMTKVMVDEFLARAENTDLLGVAHSWYGRRHQKQKRFMAMQDNLGEMFELRLPTTTALAAW